MANNPNAKDNLVPFVKGDPRINRKGRPKSFDAARELAKAIAHEKAKYEDDTTYVVDGHSVTVIEAIMRNWAQSTDLNKQKAFVEYAYGKVPNAVEVTGADGVPLIPARATTALEKVYGDES